MIRHIRKWLKAGVFEEGELKTSYKGTPQGGSISPLLANIYLHYVLDLWVDSWRKRIAKGDVIIVRYADDFIVGFQYHKDAIRFKQELKNRLLKFKLSLHPNKTRLIEFGRFASKDREGRGQGRPETFDFKYSGLIPRPLGRYNRVMENRLGNFRNTPLLAAGIENFRFDYLFPGIHAYLWND